MNITEALEKLDSYQAQIIHGPNTLGEIADAVRSLTATLETTKEMLLCERANTRNLYDWVMGHNSNPTLSGQHWEIMEKLSATEPSSKECPGCGGELESVTYPGGYLNREQWDSQKAGDYVCKVCPDNGRAANKQHAYFWEKELTAQKEENS